MINVLLSRGVIHEPWVYVYLKNYIKKTDKVLIIPFAFARYQAKNAVEFDELYAVKGTYYEKMIVSFLPYEILESNISVLNYFTDSIPEMKRQIKSADIIYFPGGLPDVMKERMIEKDITKSLEEHDGLMIGSSAGAMIQLKNYHITPDHDYHRFQFETGLDILSNINIEVHYKNNFKTRRSHKKLRALNDKPLFVIPDGGGIIIDDKRIIMLGSAKKLEM